VPSPPRGRRARSTDAAIHRTSRARNHGALRSPRDIPARSHRRASRSWGQSGRRAMPVRPDQERTGIYAVRRALGPRRAANYGRHREEAVITLSGSRRFLLRILADRPSRSHQERTGRRDRRHPKVLRAPGQPPCASTKAGVGRASVSDVLFAKGAHAAHREGLGPPALEC
jgi:hypothetical protein